MRLPLSGSSGVNAAMRRRMMVCGTRNGRWRGIGVRDEGSLISVRLGPLDTRVSKSELRKVLWPVMGIVAIGTTGTLFFGPFILAFLLLGGGVLASLSMLGAFMLAVFIVPVSVMFGLAALTTLGGLAFGVIATGLTALTWFSMISLADYMGLISAFSDDQENGNQRSSVDVPQREDDWSAEVEARGQEIAAELREFDDLLSEK